MTEGRGGARGRAELAEGVEGWKAADGPQVCSGSAVMFDPGEADVPREWSLLTLREEGAQEPGRQVEELATGSLYPGRDGSQQA